MKTVVSVLRGVSFVIYGLIVCAFIVSVIASGSIGSFEDWFASAALDWSLAAVVVALGLVWLLFVMNAVSRRFANAVRAASAGSTVYPVRVRAFRPDHASGPLRQGYALMRLTVTESAAIALHREGLSIWLPGIPTPRQACTLKWTEIETVGGEGRRIAIAAVPGQTPVGSIDFSLGNERIPGLPLADPAESEEMRQRVRSELANGKG